MFESIVILRAFLIFLLLFLFFLAVVILNLLIGYCIKKGEWFLIGYIASEIKKHPVYKQFFVSYRGAPLVDCLRKNMLVPSSEYDDYDGEEFDEDVKYKRKNELEDFETRLRKAVAKHSIALNDDEVLRIKNKEACYLNQDELFLLYRAIYVRQVTLEDTFSKKLFFLLGFSSKKRFAFLNGEFLKDKYCKSIHVHSEFGLDISASRLL